MGKACEVFSERQHRWEDVNAGRCIPKAHIDDCQDIVRLFADEGIQVSLAVKLCDKVAGLHSIGCLIPIVQHTCMIDLTNETLPVTVQTAMMETLVASFSNEALAPTVVSLEGVAVLTKLP